MACFILPVVNILYLSCSRHNSNFGEYRNPRFSSQPAHSSRCRHHCAKASYTPAKKILAVESRVPAHADPPKGNSTEHATVGGPVSPGCSDPLCSSACHRARENEGSYCVWQMHGEAAAQYFATPRPTRRSKLIPLTPRSKAGGDSVLLPQAQVKRPNR